MNNYLNEKKYAPEYKSSKGKKSSLATPKFKEMMKKYKENKK
jgi:hypothetical protein